MWNHWSSWKQFLIGYQQLTFIHQSWGNPYIINPKLYHQDAPPNFLPHPPSHEKPNEPFPGVSSTFPCQYPSRDVFLLQLLWLPTNMHHSARFYFKLHPPRDVPLEKEVIPKLSSQNLVLTKYLLQIAVAATKPWEQSALLTIKCQLSSSHVLPPHIFSHALVEPSVLLLEIGDFQEPTGAVPPGFPGDLLPIRPPPADRGHGAEEGK